jgi:hypothetical protein
MRLPLGCIALGLSLSLSPAGAQPRGRPYTPTLPCKAVAEMVRARGAVVLSTGPTTYDRYVRDRSFCQVSETLEPAWVRASDSGQCFIGYTCREFPVNLVLRGERAGPRRP